MRRRRDTPAPPIRFTLKQAIAILQIEIDKDRALMPAIPPFEPLTMRQLLGQDPTPDFAWLKFEEIKEGPPIDWKRHHRIARWLRRARKQLE